MRPTNSTNVRGGGLVSVFPPDSLETLSIQLTYVKGFIYSSAAALHRELLRRGSDLTSFAACALVVALCAVLFSLLRFFLFFLFVQLLSLSMHLFPFPEVHVMGAITSFRFIMKASVTDARRPAFGPQ